MAPVILASASPRRKQLLEWAEVDFEIMVADTDESYPAHYDPEAVAAHIALHKALAVAERAGNSRPIIAADTIVVLGGEVIGKPRDREDAIGILSRLSGKVHQVITGVSIQYPAGAINFTDTTEVAFHELTAEQVAFYVDKYKPYDKAGAYAIQEWIGVVGIKNIKGDFYNVMGLPVSRVVQALASIGY
ncbi:septum formation protein [Cnuella takakiae]|uniref:dTTP/UTP pyrophosphatase n=1 Tax=Cnuella takakiae TaxID=1302690 RepID=A0A1M4V1D0_9BACT|nr:Maf family protein [Cnuella takakiae]OLY92735.1 septum formation protein Maf [Cnuella takakiae]SHE62698.1 septum formation protein [Cnuella takakiae]